MDIKTGFSVSSPVTARTGEASGEAPGLSGSLSAANLVRGLAMAPFDTSVGFTGPSLSFALSPSSDALPEGLTLSPTGIVSGTPNVETAGASIVVRATNLFGFIDSGFQVVVIEPVFTALISGATVNPSHGNSAQDQVPLTATASGFTGATPSVFQYQWKTIESGDIAGATSQTYAPSAGAHDLETLLCTVTPEGYGASDTQTLTVRYAPPVSTGGVPDEIFDQDSGNQAIATAYDFSGDNLAFSVTGPAGATIDAATGIVSLPTAVPVSGAVVTVTGTNSGGSAVTGFMVTVEAAGVGAGVAFGALTRTGAGGVDVSGSSVTSGDPSGHWQVNTGRLTPSAAGEGALTGPYQLGFDDGSSLEVTVAADTYSARCDKTEIEAAHAHALANRAALDSVCSLRPGFTDEEIDLSASAFSGSFTLRGEGFDTNGALRPNGYSWSAQIGNVLMAGSNIHLENLEIYAPRSTAVASAVHQPSGTFISDFSVKRCHIFGDHLGEWVEAMLVANDPLTNTLNSGLNFNVGGARGVVEDNYIHDFLGVSGSNVDDYLIQGNYSENTIGGWIGTLNSGPTGIRILNNEHFGIWAALDDPGDIHSGLGGGSVIGRGSPQSETNVKGIAKGNVVLVGNARQEWEASQGRHLVTPINMAGTTGFKLNDPTSGLNGYSDWEIAHNIFQLFSPIGLQVENGENILIHHNTLVGVRGATDDPTPEDGAPAFNFTKDGAYTFADMDIWANITGPSHGMNTVLEDVVAGFSLFENEAVANSTASPVGASAAHTYAEYFEGDPVKQYGADLTPEEAIAAFTPRFWTRASQRNLGAVNAYYPIGIAGKGAVDTTPAFLPPSSAASPAAAGHGYPATVWNGTYGLQLAQDGLSGAMRDGAGAVADGNAFTIVFQGAFTGPDTDQVTLLFSNGQDLHISRNGDGVTARNRLTFDFDQSADPATRAFYYSPVDPITAARGRVCFVLSVDQGNDRVCFAVNGVVRELHNYNQFVMGDIMARLGAPDVHLFETNNGSERFVGEAEALVIENQFIDLHTRLGDLVAQDGFLRDPAAVNAAFGRAPLVFVAGNASAINGGAGNTNGRAQLVEVTNGGIVTDASGDGIAPVLTAASDAADGQNAATGSVTSDEGNGTLFWVVSTSASTPSAAQIVAGSDASGSAASASGSQAVTAGGAQSVVMTGLSPATQYYTHFTQQDAAGNRSAVVSASGFQTDPGAATGFAVDEGASTGTFSSAGGFRIWEGSNGAQLVVTAPGAPGGLELVGGGGGGGYRMGGGGGGGEVVQRTTTAPAFSAQIYTATVGAGGTGSTLGAGVNGGDTRLIGGSTDDVALAALGGGAGGVYNTAGDTGAYGGNHGGSGGGSAATSLTPRFGLSIASDGVGNDGGTGSWTSQAGAGGGGAGGVGGNFDGTAAGAGGVGVTSICPGKSDTLAPGGAGGDAVTVGNGADAVAIGGGGGGGSNSFGSRDGGAGANGIVRVWWPL